MMAETIAGLHKRIRRARKACGLTQIELGERIGVNNNKVHDWEIGRGLPRADHLAALCQTLHISADWLLGLGAEGGIQDEMNAANHFSGRLLEARTNKNLSLSALGKAVNLTPRTLERWETGIQPRQIEDMINICRTLEVSADWLLGLSEEKKSAPSAGTLEGADEKTSYRNHI